MKNLNLPSIHYLDSKQIKYKVLHLTSVARSAHDVQRLYGCSLEQILKTLVLISNEGPLIAVIQGSEELSFEKVKAFFNLTALRFATAKEVLAITGYVVGGVSPFGLPENIRKIVDKKAFDQQTLNMGGGTPFIGLELSAADFKSVWDGYIDSILAA